jgi:hypothetical protein
MLSRPRRTLVAMIVVGVAAALSPTLSAASVARCDDPTGANCPTRDDVYMADNTLDTGLEPDAPNPDDMWASPDISVCNTSTWCAPPGVPVHPGNSYWVVVRLHNPGPLATNPAGPVPGALHVYYTDAGGDAQWDPFAVDNGVTKIGDWNPIGVVPGSIPVGDKTLAVFWPKVPGPAGDYCLLARWVSATDPMYGPSPESNDTVDNTKNNNNIAWRNIDVVDLPPRTPATASFSIGNTRTDRLITDLVVTAPSVPFVGRGRILVDLGASLAAQWHAGGNQGVGVRPVGTTQVEIVDPVQARIKGLIIGPRQRIRTQLTFISNGGPPGDQFEVRVFQSDSTTGADLGGVEYHLITS